MKKSTIIRTGTLLSAAVAVWLWAPTVHAISQFPGEIRAHLGLNYLPPCSLCHASASGGGPVVTAFGVAIQQRGLSTADLTSIDRALDRLAADQVDSNHNGVTDVQDLKNGIDPNDPGNLPLTGPTPEYGCAVAAARSMDILSMAWASVGALSLLLWSRRGRRDSRACTGPAKESQ
jgi:hypothetical protein